MSAQFTPQWEALLQNLGAWHGSFTRLSPEGEVLEDTPTIVSLEGLNQNQTIRQIVRRLEPPDELVLEYSTLGRNILFHPNGAFSFGSLQLAPFAEFGTELGLIYNSRRLRLVQMFDRDHRLDRLTLIRERLETSSVPERPPLKLTDLLGTWQGEAVTLYPDWRSADKDATRLTLRQEGNRLHQQLEIGGQTIASTATIQGSQLRFEPGTQPVQVLLLPDGASSTCPVQITARQPFFLEVGWLLQPDLRQRLIRRYSETGEWVSLTLVTERKIASLD
jgi:hypothetical protein